ncbi:hypothetical protein BDY17DRAFT_190361 [Neohortaea acidophila]|uniref:Uncharacterized protein n=1 Tax=Neohortaea acidophila TaxID=245834 RepID=A0A6A6PNI0_9PEZI|nr:uncharacterized protein BDY17DRAFT_190361 [Neohortaea acidophila]KAF2481562.1 hypothetical protein BDY17DRAFT_190361 [Neohortaea acidophila]
MHSNTLAFAIVALCTPFVFAAPGHKHDDGWSSTQCYTDFGAHPAPYYTEWTTSYRHCTRTHKVTQTVTATAPTSTITSTISISTTVTASTSTLTNTHTNTSTATTTTTTVRRACLDPPSSSLTR